MSVLKGIVSIKHDLSGVNTSDSTSALSAGKGKDLEQRIETVENKLTRVGMVGIFTQPIAPAGVLYYNGALVLRTDFPYLWQWAQNQGLVDNANAAKFGTGDEVTTFRLPDWRGAFLRMTGTNGTFLMANGSGFAGAALMVTQNDQFQAWQAGGLNTTLKYGTVGADGYNAVVGGADPGRSMTFYGTALQGSAARITAVSDGTNGTPRTGPITRPRNVRWDSYVYVGVNTLS